MNQLKSTSAITAIAIYVIIFFASLLAAYVLYGLLSSTGTFNSKGAQLGGAAAGFVIVLFLSAHIFNKILQQVHSNQKDITQEDANATILRLQSTIDELLASQLAPSSVPLGFVSYISKDEGLAYSCPRDWLPREEKFLGMYHRPAQTTDGEPESFNGNITITISKLGNVANDLNQESADGIMDITRDSVVKLYSAKNVMTERTIVDGLYGRRYRGNYIHFQSGKNISFDIILALDPQSKRIFLFALHETTELIESSSTILLTIVGTAKIRK